MTDLVERSRAVRKAVYVEAGHIKDWSAHDHMVADYADEAATEIERLQTILQKIFDIPMGDPMGDYCICDSPSECCDKLRVTTADINSLQKIYREALEAT